MLLVKSREYKMMLDQRSFRDWEEGAKRFWDEVKEFVVPLGLSFNKRLRVENERTVQFLDTEDHTLLANGYVLRRRSRKNGNDAEYTLKYRTEDRYVAAGANVTSPLTEEEPKFEEDIAPPFRSRYSHALTIDVEGETPTTLKEAAGLFPVLGKLRRDGQTCPPATRLMAVNGIQAFERVLVHEDDGNTSETPLSVAGQKISVALILWSNGRNGRPLVAEFSFRYKDKKEDFEPAVAKAARRLFSVLQRMDWAHPQAMTKTEYVYRNVSETAAGD